MSYILCVNVSAVWGMQRLSWWRHVSSIESGYESADPTDDAHWADRLTHQKVNNLIIRPEIKGMHQKTLQLLPITFFFYFLLTYTIFLLTAWYCQAVQWFSNCWHWSQFSAGRHGAVDVRISTGLCTNLDFFLTLKQQN